MSLFIDPGQLPGGLSFFPWCNNFVFSSGGCNKLINDPVYKIPDRHLLSSLWTLSSIFRFTYISISIFIFHMGGHMTSHMTWLAFCFFGVLIGPIEVVIA